MFLGNFLAEFNAQVLSFTVFDQEVNIKISNGQNWILAKITDPKYTQFLDVTKRLIMKDLYVICVKKWCHNDLVWSSIISI